jgi:hypothetical protein
VNQNSNKFE